MLYLILIYIFNKVISSLLVTSKQYVGDPIDCIVADIPSTVNFKSQINKTLKFDF